jgi:polyhydroxyalkanoate synthase
MNPTARPGRATQEHKGMASTPRTPQRAARKTRARAKPAGEPLVVPVAAPPRTAAPTPTPADPPAAAAAQPAWTPWWVNALGAPPALSELPQVQMETGKLMQLQQEYVQRMGQLWVDFFEHPEQLAQPLRDNRFADPAWQKNPLAAFYARTYLLNSDFMNRLADTVEGDGKTKKRIKFAVSQFVDAASPANYLALNPKAQETLLQSKGESLKTGMSNLLADLQRGKITQTDETAFEVGRNVATSEGAVVFQNELFQLIQYKALTTKVYRRPFVLVPPCINKFYIMDLQPENSLVRFCVEQGHTVYLVSWKNPHEAESRLTWDDYVERGAIAALHVAQELSGQKQANVLGFCVGGTLVACALAVMVARGEQPVASFTLMTSLLDFEDTGVLDVFIDEAHVRLREKQLSKGGLMPGKDLANAFSSLRPNDLVWNYVVSNYLEGRPPTAFDLLYWNGDSTNLPGPMYTWYLRNTYLENNLRVPNKIKIAGVPLDLTLIDVPTYVFAAREDHIVPWKAAYASARALAGVPQAKLRYVLGASGHIAGAINPASRNKRNYWVGPDAPLPASSEAWFNAATEVPGSWWNDFARWLAPFGGPKVTAPTYYGNARYQPIEPAPGSYVKEKA